MIVCPACTHNEFVGTLYCSECGTRLIHVSPLPTMNFQASAAEAPATTTKPATPEGPELESGAIMGLKILTSDQIVSLLGRDNYTVGRSLEDQAVIPDIDLNQFGAYDHGVSRIHAELRLEEDGAFILDLDSANGTLVNGEKVDPQTPVAVKHGDIIQFGHLKVQLLSRYRK